MNNSPKLPFKLDADFDIVDAKGWLVCCPACLVWPDDGEHALSLCVALNHAYGHATPEKGPPDAEIMAHPKVKALVEAAKTLLAGPPSPVTGGRMIMEVDCLNLEAALRNLKGPTND